MVLYLKKCQSRVSTKHASTNVVDSTNVVAHTTKSRLYQRCWQLSIQVSKHIFFIDLQHGGSRRFGSMEFDPGSDTTNKKSREFYWFKCCDLDINSFNEGYIYTWKK